MNPLSRPADTATLPLFPASGESAAPEVASGPARQQDASEGAPNGNPWEWCPNCGSKLHNERCKRRCPRCHYFMSCSDFD